jgi:hypothetical protein
MQKETLRIIDENIAKLRNNIFYLRSDLNEAFIHKNDKLYQIKIDLHAAETRLQIAIECRKWVRKQCK